MRESNYTIPPSNRAVITISQMLYDRRALDTNSTLALLNNLCQLTYLTSTSPRIREVLTMDGGLERMLDILRESCLPHEPTMPDLWGLNGPSTARTINVDRAISLRHSLAFQCVVNIGVRGNEVIRTRVVQAGALDIVAQILESWLKKNGIAVFSSSLGSQAAVDALAAGQIPPVAESRRRRQGSSRYASSAQSRERDAAPPQPSAFSAWAREQANEDEPLTATATGRGGLGQLMVTLIANRLQSRLPLAGPATAPPAPDRPDRPIPSRTASSVDTDVDMADGETEGGDTDTAGDTDTNVSMDIEPDGNQQTTTPRARLPVLPLQIPRRSPEPSSEAASASTSNAASLSGDEPATLPRARSDNSLAMTNAAAAAESGRPASGLAARVPMLGTDTVSTQSSPNVLHAVEHVEGMRGRRGTVVGRPLLLQSRDQRQADESEASDGVADGEADIAHAAALAAAANAAMEAAAAVPNQPENAPQPAIVEGMGGMGQDEPDPEMLAAEQARFDLEAGAPPGQPGAAQTPRVTTTDVQMQATATVDPTLQVPTMPPQIIIANHAPRGFQDLASYVQVSQLLNPDGTNYSEDNILLALQLLAYLSKYAHVRATFHHPRRPMHRTFDLGDDGDVPLPQRPAYSETPNIFSLVERFTFCPSPSDRGMFPIPAEIQYWAGVIMRNACRKDDAQGGIRQCAYMSCGKWEKFPREFAKCRRCRKAKYCSKDCQSKAWSEGHRFWCSLRTENEPSADGATRRREGGDRTRDRDREGRDRDRGDRDRSTGDGEDDDDVDMDGPGPQATPRAAARSNTRTETIVIDPHTAEVVDGEEEDGERTPPAGAAPPSFNFGRTTPRPRASTPVAQSSTWTGGSSAVTPPNGEHTSPESALSPAWASAPLAPTAPTPPAPRPVPSVLKFGAGPSSTSDMNAAMSRGTLHR